MGRDGYFQEHQESKNGLWIPVSSTKVKSLISHIKRLDRALSSFQRQRNLNEWLKVPISSVQ